MAIRFGEERMNMQVSPPNAERDVPAHETLAGRHPARRYLIGGIALVAVLGGYYYWSHGADGPARRPIGAAPVRVADVVSRDMSVVEHTIGTVVANSTVSVTARVQGQLTKAFFKEGQMVKTGDLLFQIDPSPYQAAYDATLATLQSAKTNAERSASLLKANAIAPQVDDNNQAAYQQAKANAE